MESLRRSLRASHANSGYTVEYALTSQTFLLSGLTIAPAASAERLVYG
jgi:hypothetical protein